MDDNVAQFMSFTDQSADVAQGFLSMTEGDVMAAVNMFFENPEIAESFRHPQPADVPAAAGPATTNLAAASSRSEAASHRAIGRQDNAGVIHLDSDDDEQVDDFEDLMDSDDNGPASPNNPETLQRIAQETDDADMARRLQDELYGAGAGGAQDPDGVRAPIGRTTETLIAPGGYAGYAANAGDEEREAALRELHRRAARPAMRNNPFGHSIWDDDEAPAAGRPGLNDDGPAAESPSYAGAAGGASREQNSRAQRLTDLFRPPYELMEHLPWEEARDVGKQDKRWLLVNVQDMGDFNCQALNRDIWKDSNVVALVKENFIFLQYGKADPRATEYSTFYFNSEAQENRDNFPHVAIIDPRTGEQVKVWSGIPFPKPLEFHAQLVEFLDRYSLDKSSKNPVVKQKAPQRALDVERMTEDEMLEMAMRNSLGEANGKGTGSGSGSGSNGGTSLHDPDALTKSVELDKGKGKAVDDEVMDDAPSEEDTQRAAFAAIAADKPHEEPAQGPNITRIQFRHPEGRVVRRFAVTDRVRRIYEWLKAEKGVSFELKIMPSGRDLLADVDKTIEEAELKQTTVLIEYVE